MGYSPDFFIMGAPKCGTTALAAYLSSHPGVFIPRIKEPHYFCTDFPAYRRVTTEADYERLYDEGNGRTTGDCSVWYLYSEIAARRIVDANPDAKIIVMIRNPVMMLHSLHGQLVYSGREDIVDFERAWVAQDDRSRGRKVPKNCLEPKHLQYARIAEFSSQIARVHENVDPARVKIIVFDEFVSNTRRVYNEVLGFLDLPDDDRREFQRVNENRYHRFPRLARTMMYPPFPLDIIKQTLKRGLGAAHSSPLRSVYGALSRKQQRPQLNPKFRADLIEHFNPEVTRLEALLGTDLSAWKSAS